MRIQQLRRIALPCHQTLDFPAHARSLINGVDKSDSERRIELMGER